VRITRYHIIAFVVIIAMVYGLRQADLAGWFDNPTDMIPSVEIGK
jgi:hypothetical protein